MFLQPSEAGKTMHLVRESTRDNAATVFWAHGTLEGKPRAIAIPVDSVTQRITFTFSTGTKGTQLTLRQPSGGIVAGGSSDLEITELNCGRIVTVRSPEPGEWQAQINGSGKYWLEAKAQSEISFIKAEFVKKGGRPGHEGWFRISGEPLAGKPAVLDAYVSSKAKEGIEFYLAGESGEELQKLAMSFVSAGGETLEFLGKTELPGTPFRVAIRGQDPNGKPYQRFFSTLFHAETVEVSSKPDFEELAPGSTQQVAFVVHNLGAARAFRATVSDARQFVTSVEPKKLNLGEGKSGTVLVDLKVPSDAAPGVGDNLIVVVSSTSGEPTSNSMVVRFSVAAATPAEDPEPPKH